MKLKKEIKIEKLKMRIRVSVQNVATNEAIYSIFHV